MAGKENARNDKSSFEVLTELVRYLGKSKIRGERELERTVNKEVSQYEVTIQQLEAKVREHIAIEQQLRLYVEDAKEKIADFHRKYKKACENEIEMNKEIAKLKNLLDLQYVLLLF